MCCSLRHLSWNVLLRRIGVINADYQRLCTEISPIWAFGDMSDEMSDIQQTKIIAD
jgi:hypothetical protein